MLRILLSCIRSGAHYSNLIVRFLPSSPRLLMISRNCELRTGFNLCDKGFIQRGSPGWGQFGGKYAALNGRRRRALMAARSLPSVGAHGGLTRYLEEIRQFPMLEPQQEYMLAKSWREHGDRDAAHHLVTSHLRLVARIAMGYRGYGLPIGEVISEGNVGLMQAVKRFDPDKGFRLATYAMWWIRAAIQEYILRSWSLVKMGTTAAQKKLFFNLRKAKSEIAALQEGDLRPDQVSQIATKLGVLDSEVISMNRRLSGPDASLNAPLRSDSENEWQDWLEDKDAVSQEDALVESDQTSLRMSLPEEAMT